MFRFFIIMHHNNYKNNKRKKFKLDSIIVKSQKIATSKQANSIIEPK